MDLVRQCRIGCGGKGGGGKGDDGGGLGGGISDMDRVEATAMAQQSPLEAAAPLGASGGPRSS